MNFLQRLGERFWFVPSVLCLTFSVLAWGLVWVDRRLRDWSPPSWVNLFVYQVGESGSRDILGAIASSSLAVAGTTFSITIAVLALTSSSYGPRLVRNFMADRGNQVVLGVYVATFLYCLLVLRSIRALADAGDQDADVFVPHLATNGAVLLAVANVGVLVYFIHHISDSIQIATLARGVRSSLCATVERLYPEGVGDEAAPLDPELPFDLERQGVGVRAGKAGYVQFVRDDTLLNTAAAHDVLVVMQVRPGRYVLADTVVAIVHPPEQMAEDLADHVRKALEITDSRTPYQDLDFAVQQLTEMAVRALSPSTNDPYTAINALDDLSVGLTMLASRPTPSPWRRDADGAVRVHSRGSSATDLFGVVMDTMRWYARSTPLVLHHCLELIDRVGERNEHDDLRTALLTNVDLLRDTFAAGEFHPHDVEQFAAHADEVQQRLTRAR